MIRSRTKTLMPCLWCAGRGCVPTQENVLETCPACDGGKFEPVWGDLGETRTHKRRPYQYNPGTGALSVTRQKGNEKAKPTNYLVTEFACDQTPGEHPTRGFEVAKLDITGHATEKYHVEIGKPSWHKCSCMGFLSEAVAKGNKRAWTTGEPIGFTTFGCVHVDAVLEFYWAGLFDKPSDGPEVNADSVSALQSVS